MNFLRNLFGKKEKETVRVVTRPDGIKEMRIKNPSDALDILFWEALSDAPYITEVDVLFEYQSMKRAWGSIQLFRGNREEMRGVILPNLKRLSSKSEFTEFAILALPDQRCAQVMALFTTSTFTGVRVWKTQSAIYVCGNSAFTGPSSLSTYAL